MKHGLTEAISSLVATLALLPAVIVLCEFADLPLLNGLAGYAIGLLVVGLFGGSPVQINAPTTSLALICIACWQEHGIAGMTLAVTGAGVGQILLGFFGAGTYFRMLPVATLKGLMAGIGISIIIGQVPGILGAEKYDDIFEISSAVPLMIGFGCLAIIWSWSSFGPRRARTYVPGILLGVGAAMFVTLATGQQNGAPISYNYEVPWTTWPTNMFRGGILMYGVSLAAVATIKTLLTTIKLSSLSNQSVDLNRELIAQGVANTICGLAGALPIAAHMSRSVVNFELGTRTRINQVGQFFWLAVFTVFGFGLVNYLPTPAMAAVLVYSGIKLIDWRFLLNNNNVAEKSDRILVIVTALCVVFSGVHFGVTMGLILTLFRLTATLSHDLDCRVKPDPTGENQYVLKLSGAVTFLHLPHLYEARGKIPADAKVVVDVGEVYYFDPSCVAFFTEWQGRQKAASGTITIDFIKLLQKSNFSVQQRDAILEELRKTDRRYRTDKVRGGGRRVIDRILWANIEEKDPGEDKISLNKSS